MLEHIHRVLDILEHQHQGNLLQAIDDVQESYLEIIRHSLSLLTQSDAERCEAYLGEQRDLLEPGKERIATLVHVFADANNEHHKLVIEYLYTRARLVDEIRAFPNFAIELLERPTMSESLEETISHLERSMTGKVRLYTELQMLTDD
ncbi:MAG TPA: hypothetical protein DCM54_00410 [Gammaproteobacteria bacterium]|nr:hypothetical protein [Gammaproteobacteria bacterium]|tara:strand:- start:1649 stop:2092 length:444 start_codon:yes stop_codon:yes gene_type:complete